MTSPLSNLSLEEVVGENMIAKLDEYDHRIEEYYLSLNDQKPTLKVFEDLLHLHSVLLLAMSGAVPSFSPKFSIPSAPQQLVEASAVGALRALRTAHALLLRGYFVEMHATLRMVEQWLECAVFAEAYPEEAEQVLENGLERHYVQRMQMCLKGTEVGELFKRMRVAFGKLSQRTHPLKDAMNLIRRKDGSAYCLGGILSNDNFAHDAIGLANMARNALNVFSRHFEELSPEWRKEYADTCENLKEEKQRHTCEFCRQSKQTSAN